MAIVITNTSGGVDWRLELERDRLLPGQTARGRVGLTFRSERDARGVVAALIATEQWQYETTSRDAQGNTHTKTVTKREELRRVPVQLAGPTSFGEGEVRDYALELPVPPLGPATLDGTVSRLTWELEVKLDVPNRTDSAIVAEVIVLQPTALLRAGVVDVAQFALWPSADAVASGSRASIALDPVPLCVAAPFGGLLSIATGAAKLQEVRLELRVLLSATVSSGLKEEITLWESRVAGEGVFGGEERAMAFNGELPARWLPTVRLPHGRADATFHVILAKAWAPDIHLVRDVAICSTTEL